MRSVNVVWDSAGHRFSAVGKNTDFTIATDSPRAAGEVRPPNGFSPTELLLAGAGACSAWDMVDMLRKQRTEPAELTVRVEGEQEDVAPYAYKRIVMHYRIVGDRLRPGVVKRLVRLSIKRYCSVLATTAGVARTEADIELIGVDGSSSGVLPVDLEHASGGATEAGVEGDSVK